jgi:putative transposase
MVTPAARRQAAGHVVSELGLSERRACRVVGLSRSVFHYRSCRPGDSPLRQRLRTLAEQYPKYGYPTLHDMLKTEGLVQNRKRTYRLYCEEGLQVRVPKSARS